MCLLRERGDAAGAEQVRTGALAEAVIALRTRIVATAEEIERQLELIVVSEQERVANAAVLAELLAPMLQANLPSGRVANAGLDSATPSVVLPAPPSPAAPRPPPDNIADFIDEMLAQEKTGQRPAPTRRAS